MKDSKSLVECQHLPQQHGCCRTCSAELAPVSMATLMLLIAQWITAAARMQPNLMWEQLGRRLVPTSAPVKVSHLDALMTWKAKGMEFQNQTSWDRRLERGKHLNGQLSEGLADVADQDAHFVVQDGL